MESLKSDGKLKMEEFADNNDLFLKKGIILINGI